MIHNYFRGLRPLLAGALLALVLLLAGGPAVRAQAPAWQAAVAANGISGVRAMATDSAGNVFLAGFFSGNANFGPAFLSSVGGGDVFVAKWSPATGFVWAVQGGGSEEESVDAIAVEGHRIYITGTFTSNAALFGNTQLTNVGPTVRPITNDVFVARLTDGGPRGTFDWAERLGGVSYDEARAIAVRGTDVYLGGNYRGTISLGQSGLTMTNAGTSLDSDGYVVKLTDAGTFAVFLWGTSVGAVNYETIDALVAHPTGVYVAGTFSSYNLRVAGTVLYNRGGSDAFVARLNDTGPAPAFAWVQYMGSAGEDQANALAVSGKRLYLAGSFSGSYFVTDNAVLRNTTSARTSDIYVVQLTDTGPTATVGWAESVGNLQSESVLAATARGNSVYLTGTFQSDLLAFGPSVVANVSPVPVQGVYNADIFVARLVDDGPSGHFVWGQAAGGPQFDQGRAVAVAGTTVYVSGSVVGPASFGSQALVVPPYDYAAFLASLADPVALPTRAAAGALALAVAPNPAHAAATVRVPAVPGILQATLCLLDGLGRVVHRQLLALPAAGATAELPLANLAPGLYHVLVQAGAGRASCPLVVE